MKYGPQTEEIEALIGKISGMTRKQAVDLEDVWDAVPDAAREDVWDAVWNIVRDAPWDATWEAAWNDAREAVWNWAVWDAIWETVVALLVRDSISAEHFDTLYGPWKSAMEESE